MIPAGVERILEVGAADGFLTEHLGGHRFVVASDVSYELIRHNPCPMKVRFSADRLPFPDSSFELLLASEVIEHLPEEVYRRALLEFARVSRHYLLVSVPYDEYLLNEYARCPFCRCVFQASGHLRSFPPGALDSLFPGFLPAQRELIGKVERRLRSTRFEIWLRHLLGDYFVFGHHIRCPQCTALLDKKPRRRPWHYLPVAVRALQGLFLKGTLPHWQAVLYQRR